MSLLVLQLLMVSGAGVLFWHFVSRVVEEVKGTQLTADGWNIRMMMSAHIKPVSAPYCWRPLMSTLGRWIGPRVTSSIGVLMMAVFAGLLVGPAYPMLALLVAGSLVLSPYYGDFCIRHWDYGDGINYGVMFAAFYGISTGAPWAPWVLILTGLGRESASIAAGIWAASHGHWGWACIAPASTAIAYLLRVEGGARHPLTEATKYETLKRWIRIKESSLVEYWHTARAYRGYICILPFVWCYASGNVHAGFLAFIPIWFLSWPASGQTRALSYGIPIIIACFGDAIGHGASPALLGSATLLNTLWPLPTFSSFDESGGQYALDPLTGEWTAAKKVEVGSQPPEVRGVLASASEGEVQAGTV